MKQEREYENIGSDVIYRGEVREFLILEDGSMLIGIEIEYMRQLDMTDKTSVVHIFERVFLHLHQCVFIVWQKKSIL